MRTLALIELFFHSLQWTWCLTHRNVWQKFLVLFLFLYWNFYGPIQNQINFLIFCIYRKKNKSLHRIMKRKELLAVFNSQVTHLDNLIEDSQKKVMKLQVLNTLTFLILRSIEWCLFWRRDLEILDVINTLFKVSRCSSRLD